MDVKELFDPETEELLEKFRNQRDQGMSFEELETLARGIADRGDYLAEMMGRKMAKLRRIGEGRVVPQHPMGLVFSIATKEILTIDPCESFVTGICEDISACESFVTGICEDISACESFVTGICEDNSACESFVTGICEDNSACESFVTGICETIYASANFITDVCELNFATFRFPNGVF